MKITKKKLQDLINQELISVLNEEEIRLGQASQLAAPGTAPRPRLLREFTNEPDPGRRNVRSPFRIHAQSKSGEVWVLDSMQDLPAEFSDNEQYILQMVSRTAQALSRHFNSQIEDLYRIVDDLAGGQTVVDRASSIKEGIKLRITKK